MAGWKSWRRVFRHQLALGAQQEKAEELQIDAREIPRACG